MGLRMCACADQQFFSHIYRKGLFSFVLVWVLLLWLLCFSLDFATRSSKQTYKTYDAWYFVRVHIVFWLRRGDRKDFACLFVIERRRKHIAWYKIRRMFHSDKKKYIYIYILDTEIKAYFIMWKMYITIHCSIPCFTKFNLCKVCWKISKIIE